MNELKQKIDKITPSNPAIIRIMDMDCNTIITIGAWDSCEHPLKDIAMKFIEEIKSNSHKL